MKILGIVISDGIGYRNFIYSTYMENAFLYKRIIIFSFLPKTIFGTLPENIKIIECYALHEKFITWFFRKIKEVAHLKHYEKDNFGIHDNYRSNYSTANNVRGISVRLIYFITKWLHSEFWINFFYNLQLLTLQNNQSTKAFEKYISEEKVDVLFFTHQRPPFIAPAILAAKKRKIPFGTFIFSWDNLASKGRMAGNFHCFLVWSDLMKEELLRFYPQTKPEQIHVVGTPQFEPYVMPQYAMTKEAFYKRFNLDKDLKTICFSCGDISTSKNDELYISTLADFILTQSIEPVNFIVRTSPAEDPKRFDVLKHKYPWIVWNYPKWFLSRETHSEIWTQRVPHREDVMDLRALTEYSDLNINMLSTMSLDFMIFDKPVINPVFGNSTNGLYDDSRFLRYEHIRHLVELNASKIVINSEELKEAITTYLSSPEVDRGNRKAFVALEIGKPLNKTGKRIAEIVNTWE